MHVRAGVLRAAGGERPQHVAFASCRSRTGARAALGTYYPLVIPSKEVWCSGIVIRDFGGCKGVRRGPLYDAYGVTPWATQSA